MALLYEWEIQQNTEPLLHQAHNTIPPFCVVMLSGHPSIHKVMCVLGQLLLDLKKSHESHKKVPRRECARALVCFLPALPRTFCQVDRSRGIQGPHLPL